LILGGAALQRCGNCFVLSPALAAEVTLSGRERLFPQPLQPCRPSQPKMRALAPEGVGGLLLETHCPLSLSSKLISNAALWLADSGGWGSVSVFWLFLS
jgi:hypothetical protein